MFIDRNDAGRRLARMLKDYSRRKFTLVLGLPRGGVVVASEIALQLSLPLDVLIVRKIGHPLQPELAIGAMSETGTVELNQSLMTRSAVSRNYLDSELAIQAKEIARRIELYRSGKKIQPLEHRTVILVDDGVATGATMKAAVRALRSERVGRLVIAVPVAAPETAEELMRMADELVCLEMPPDFMAVGNYYEHFSQVSDEEVVTLLQQLSKRDDQEQSPPQAA